MYQIKIKLFENILKTPHSNEIGIDIIIVSILPPFLKNYSGMVIYNAHI